MKKTLKYMAMLLCAAMVFGVASCDRNEDTADDNNTQTTPTTPDTPTNPDNPVLCGETIGEWVDLGLPSGLLWYSVNIGAISPEQYGCYFAWGETQTQEEYSWDTYTYGYCDSSTRTYTYTYTLYKYNTLESYGTVDNKTVLEASDDVATAVLGAGARIPTYDDWVELRNNTSGEQIEHNGVNGWKFTAANGNSLFLPAAGYRYGGSRAEAGVTGYYWSSSLYTDRPYKAYCLNFHHNSSGMGYGDFRSYGRAVRAVKSTNNK